MHFPTKQTKAIREVQISTSFCTSRINMEARRIDMGMHLRGDMGMDLRGDIHLQCEERLHALSNLLGFRDASFEFGDAFGIAWVCAEEVAAS